MDAVIRQSQWVCLVVGVATACHGAPPAAEDGHNPAVGAERTHGSESEIVRMIEDLGSADWQLRQTATQRLMDQGPEIYEPLRQAFRHGKQYEIRRRIKRIARELRVSELLGPTRGFLGIQHPRNAQYSRGNARIPPGATGLLIMDVIPWTAAAAAGLEPGDLLMALNGRRATTEHTALSFPDWIKLQQPGTRCRFGILRGGTGWRLDPKERPGFDPRSFAKHRTRVVLHTDDPRIPKGGAAIRIEDVNARDNRMNLEAGDLIIALDGQALPADRAEDLFTGWTQGRPISETLSDPPVPFIPQFAPGNFVAHDAAPSAQILRGGRWLDVDVVLRRKRAYRPDGRPLREGAAEAEDGFEAWWGDWFAPSGIPADRFDANLSWRLEP